MPSRLAVNAAAPGAVMSSGKRWRISAGKTNRGFRIRRFSDRYNVPCSLQKSSLATVDAIWIGVDDPQPKCLARDAPRLIGTLSPMQLTGWVPFPIPEEVQLTTRMHLTRTQVKQLLPLLQHFVDTGELP